MGSPSLHRPPRDNAMCPARPEAGERLLLVLGDPQCLLEVICRLLGLMLSPWVAMTSPQRRWDNQADIWGAESLFQVLFLQTLSLLSVPSAPLGRHH